MFGMRKEVFRVGLSLLSVPEQAQDKIPSQIIMSIAIILFGVFHENEIQMLVGIRNIS